jgi:hypothetical protein
MIAEAVRFFRGKAHRDHSPYTGVEVINFTSPYNHYLSRRIKIIIAKMITHSMCSSLPAEHITEL